MNGKANVLIDVTPIRLKNLDCKHVKTLTRSLKRPSSSRGSVDAAFNNLETLTFGSSEGEDMLKAMGYQSELKREFTMFSAFSFAVSISGLFATVGTTFVYPLEAGGSASVIWCWFIGGVGCLSIALSVAEIVSAYPTSGGMYYACCKLFPANYVPCICWVDGWLNALGQTAGVASSDYGAALMLLSAVEMGTNFSYQATAKHAVGVMAAIVIFHATVNSFPTKYLERLTWMYTVFHFSCLIAGAIALLVKADPRNDASYVFTNIQSSSGWSPVGFAFLFGFLSVSWTMTDYDATAHICEEMQEPEKKAPWAIALAMCFTYIIGWLYNVVLCFCMGDPASILTKDQPVAYIYYRALGRGGGVFFTVAMFIIMNFVGISSLHASSRTVWAQSRDKMLPFSKLWYRVNRRTKTPLYAVWINAALCICINLIALGSTTTINAIFNVCAIALDWSYIIPIVGKVVFPKLFKRGPWHLGRASVFINVFAILWTTFVSVIFFMPTNMPVTPSNMNYAVVFFVGVIGFSLLCWHLGGKKVYTGPKPTQPDPIVASKVDLRGEVKDNKID